MEWKNVLYVVGVICLLFFGIPIKIKKQPEKSELLFQSFVEKYKKPYKNNETEYWDRFRHFQEALLTIELLNANRTENSAFYGITSFCDLSKEEFKKRHLRRKHNEHNNTKKTRRKRAPAPLPPSVDWRNKGIVTSVRNQRACGACWAFSTIETVESMNALLNRTLQTFSVQEIIDCAGNGNNGCEGGDSRLLLEWLLTNKIKIEPEVSYPYLYETDVCRYKGTENGVQVKSFACKSMVGSEDGMLNLLANHGPVAVAVNAANWQFYLGGVIQYHCPGALMDLNHAVQIVGYVNSGLSPHYIARNSWGTEFGDGGYLYLSIGSNVCGVASEVCSLDVL